MTIKSLVGPKIYFLLVEKWIKIQKSVGIFRVGLVMANKPFFLMPNCCIYTIILTLVQKHDYPSNKKKKTNKNKTKQKQKQNKNNFFSVHQP